MPRNRTLTQMFLVSVLAFGSTAALGAPRDPPTEAELQQAREQFALGRKLEDEGRFLEALGIFQEIGEVKMTPQVRFHIALCLEKTGHLVEALETFKLATSEAASSSKTVVKEADEHVADLEKRIPKLVVSISGGLLGDELTLDGRTLTPPTDLAVDPGPHTLAILRDGKIIRTQSITLEEGKSLQMELAPPAPPAPVPTQPPPPPPPLAVEQPAKQQVGHVEPSVGRLQRMFGWSVLGLSAASAVGLGISAGLRADRLSALMEACPTLTNCGRNVEPIERDGHSYATMVNVFGITTGVTVITGGLLLLLAPSAARESQRAGLEIRVDSTLGFDNAYVTMRGRF